jgi:surface antigen
LSDQVKQRLDAGIQPQRKVFRKWRTKLRRQTVQQKVIRRGLLGFNILILLVIVIFVFQKPTASSSSTNLADLNTNAINSLAPNPLDQLASANIALTVAQMNNLPETTAINDQANSQQAELAMSSTADNIISKPEVAQTTLKSRADIQSYVVQSGDSIASIANKFGVTSDSIIWSNSLNGGNVLPGQTITIPPVNGIVYTVKSGDTPASLAQQFQANESQIIAYNDAELSGIYAGEEIIIPNGTESSGGGSSLSSAGWLPAYGSNGYDFGYCTWYVASQIAVPDNWGNAATWSYYAALSGWNVSNTPTVGSIAQTPYAAGGQGHVAIVDAVSADGSQIMFKDMNGIAGWGRVGQSGWVSVSTYANYITH